MKYKYRNGQPTRKMKRYIKMTQSPYSIEEQMRIEEAILR